MAQVSSGYFETNASQNRSLKFSWSVDRTSIEQNYKKIYWSLVGSGSASGYIMAGDFKVIIDGETVYNSSGRIELRNGTVVASGYKILYHDTQGKKTFSASVESSIYEYAVDNKGSGTWELPTIPRYVNITNFSVNKRDETSVICNWNLDATCNGWQYSVNGGGWKDFDNSQAIINGLSPNTTYTFKVRIRRKDSGLWSETDTVKQTTYDYPHCTNSPNFTIGDALTLDFYNPLGRTFSVIGYSKVDNSGIFGDETNKTRLVGFNDEIQKGFQYASIPNAQEGEYKVVVEYNGVKRTRDSGNKYKVRGTEVPTINAFSYFDDNDDVVAITQNNQHIVQNKSILKASFEAATPNFGAGSIAKYIVECNGKREEVTAAGNHPLGTVDGVRNCDLTLTVVDSRGLSATKTIDVTMIAYSEPSAVVTLERKNNHEDETYFSVDGSVSSVDGKNTMAIEYRYKALNGEYNSFEPIGDREKLTFSFDKNNSYIFNIVVTDAFDSKFDKEYVLYKGVFPFFIDTKKNACGVNTFPSEGEALRVARGVSHFEDGIKIGGKFVADYPVEMGTQGMWTYIKYNSGVAECWGRVVTTDKATWSNTQAVASVGLPFAFTEPPIVACSGGQKGYAGSYITHTESTEISITSYMQCSIEPSDSANCWFYFQVKGRWK
jgi:hypothetical protein